MNPVDATLWSQPPPTVPAFKEYEPTPPYERYTSFVDLAVSEILERYQHDTELLKHILAAKAEEDKVRALFVFKSICNTMMLTKTLLKQRRAAEELRRAEEARLQTKYLELFGAGTEHHRESTDAFSLIDGFGNIFGSCPCYIELSN